MWLAEDKVGKKTSAVWWRIGVIEEREEEKSRKKATRENLNPKMRLPMQQAVWRKVQKIDAVDLGIDKKVSVVVTVTAVERDESRLEFCRVKEFPRRGTCCFSIGGNLELFGEEIELIVD